MRISSLMLGSLLLACTAAPSSPPSQAGPVHRFSDNWILGGDSKRTVTCIPQGEVLTLRGTIVLRPFRKEMVGAMLRVSADDEWILAYRAEGVLLDLDGKSVEVTGRACEKQLQAMAGKHFDLATLQVLAER
jgi:hypothetical protein